MVKWYQLNARRKESSMNLRRRLLFSFACLTSVLVGRSADAEVGFRLHSLDIESEHHSCAVIDVNRDGLPDIISSGWWYEAPHWKRHLVRQVEKIRGRFDDYSQLVMDVNADGWPDFISANYRSQSIYWVENPGAKETIWEKHEIARPGPMETGRLADVNGDGRMDVLPNGVKFAAWWELKRTGDTVNWIKHDLPEELAGHGIGIGDVNGDGRDDLVGTKGWAEAPENRIDDRWVFHADFRLDRDDSVPILVWDVDKDGDQDIVWGRGHNIGLYWLEQSRNADEAHWVRHAIDSSWSQPHSILSNSRRVGCEWGVRWDAIARVARYAV
jgi:hypothetical protein